MVLIVISITIYLSFIGYDYYQTPLEEKFYHPSMFKPSGTFGIAGNREKCLILIKKYKSRIFINNLFLMPSEKFPFISETERREKLLNRNYTQRFELLMRLIRINKMLQKARIEYPSH